MRPTPALLVIGVTSLVALYGNWVVEERGVSDQILLDNDNIVVQEQAEAKEQSGFSVPVTFTVDVMPGWERRMLTFLTQGRSQLAGLWLAMDKLPTLRDPNDENEIVRSYPCLTAGKMPLDQWIAQTNANLTPQEFHALERDPVCGDFIWTMGEHQEITQVFIQYYPPKGEPELVTAWDIYSLLSKGKPFPWWRLWNIDIQSQWEGINVVGWVMARFLIHIALLLSSACMFLLSIPFMLRLFKANLGAWKPALIATGLVTTALLWQRGAMGLVGIKESPFIILAYSVIPIAGPSFILRMFKEGTKAYSAIALVGLAGSLSFANLLPWQVMGFQFGFQITHVVELAFAAILGILIAKLMATVFLPSFVTARDIQPSRNWFDQRYERFVSWNVHWMGKTAFGLSKGYWPYAVVAAILAMFCATLHLLANGGISTATDVHALLKGSSLVERIKLLNTPGGPGQAAGHYYVRCSGEFPKCMKEMRQWLDEVAQIPLVASQVSILPSLEDTSTRFLGEAHPSVVMFPNVWEPFEAQMETYRPQLWEPQFQGPPNAIHVTIGIANTMNDEVKLVFDEVRRLCTKHSALSCFVFDNDAIYGEVGPMLTSGMVSNMSSSIVTVFIMAALLIWFFQRRSRMHMRFGLGGLIATLPFQFALSIYLLVGIKASGNALDMAAACIVALLLDAGIDFCFYFLRTLALNLQKGMESHAALEATFYQEAPLILEDGFQNASGFLLLNGALFKPVRDLGNAMVFITVLAQIGTLVLMVPALTLAIRHIMPVQEWQPVSPMPTERKAA